MPGLAFAPELNDIARMLARDLGGIKDGTLGKIRGYCAGCNDPIRDSDTVTFAQNAMYHQEHFQCETCRSPLLNVNYHVHDEQPMCSNCFADTVLPKCAGCRKAIAADMVSLLGTQFHPDCLTCALCRTGLVGKPVFPDQDGTTTDSAAVVPAVLCQSCYENKHAPECSRCTKKILPMAAGSKAEYVVVNGRKFHSTCFVNAELRSWTCKRMPLAIASFAALISPRLPPPQLLPRQQQLLLFLLLDQSKAPIDDRVQCGMHFKSKAARAIPFSLSKAISRPLQLSNHPSPPNKIVRPGPSKSSKTFQLITTSNHAQGLDQDRCPQAPYAVQQFHGRGAQAHQGGGARNRAQGGIQEGCVQLEGVTRQPQGHQLQGARTQAGGGGGGCQAGPSCRVIKKAIQGQVMGSARCLRGQYYLFSLTKQKIEGMSRHHRAGNDDNDELGSLRAHLGVGIQAADELEHEVVARASAQMNALSTESDRRRLDKLDATIEGVYDKMSALEDRIERAPVDKRGSLRRQLRSLTDSLPGLLDEQSAIQARIRDRTASDNADLDSRRPAAADALASISRVPAASDRERLLREGKITPFATDEEVRRALAPMNATGPTGGKTAVSSIRRDFVDFSDTESREDGQIGSSSDDGEDDDDDVDIVGSSVPKRRRRPIAPRSSHHRTHEKPPRRSARRGSNDSDGRSDDGSGSFVLSGADGSADGDRTESDDGTAASSPDHRPAAPTGTHYAATTDDGDETHYRKRLRRWATFHRRERLAALPATASGGGGDVHDTAESDDEDHDLDPESEVFVPGATADLDLGGGLRVPGSIHPHLFQYQRTCLSWLWELHQQKVGGIIGDEMGLGKTTQTVSFLASLVYSRQLGRGKPVLIVCPATVMAQWVKEFHQWFPPMRVVVLHASGAGAETSGAQNGSSSKKRRRQGRYASTSEEELEDFDSDQEHAPRRKPKKSSAKSPTSTYGDFGDDDDKVLNARYDEKSIKQVKSRPWVRDLVNRVTRDGHIVITTYGGIRGYAPDLLGVQWGYAVLDEGHKIRNPDSAITILCKQLKTPHRIILSGTPIQNNLAELWSLFDWVYPGRLGTLPVFQTEFAVPINIGGYANASNVQIQTAYKCACVLRDLIQPFILRRLKADVAQDLPTKSEQVLFCKLTRQQRELYRRFLASSDAESILQGKLNSLYGIDALRKICNHPKLHNKDLTFDPELSGKLVVVRELLRLWHDERHKVLLFCQTRQMLDVIQHMVVDMKLKYSRMDGTTPVKQRPVLVDQFNNDPSHFVFLLTTKVGGLGVNLTGANRIIIYDPDWNPATDAQARERAWRLGQTRHVTIYRLMTTGTIEEKIYHRQIFKQHLSSKVLSDPKQRRYFKLHDLNDLFTLGDEDKVSSETSSLARSSAAAAAGRNDDDLVAGLEGVARLEDFHQPDGAATSSIIGSISASSPSTSSSSSARTAASGAGEDARILSTLLGSSTVATAIQHDAVMAESRPEFIIVEREAQKVAAAAVAALRASRGTRRGQDVSVPTWTGRSGGGPGGRRFGSKAGAGAGAGSSASGSASPRLSSASLLQNLRERGGGSRPESPRDGRPAFASTTAATVSLADISQQELIVQIRDYLASVGGTAPSGDIVRHFKLKLTANDVATFRAMLTAIATFKKHLATGWWTLKDEFKD